MTEKSENIAKVASSLSEYMSQGISKMDDSRINNFIKKPTMQKLLKKRESITSKLMTQKSKLI